jgi:hypothetical protein
VKFFYRPYGLFSNCYFTNTLSWFIYINPYTFPWCYLAAAVDWTEDVLQGIVPAILGVNITGTIFLGFLE